MSATEKLDNLHAVLLETPGYTGCGLFLMIGRMRPQYSWANVAKFLTNTTQADVNGSALRGWLRRRGYEGE